MRFSVGIEMKNWCCNYPSSRGCHSQCTKRSLQLRWEALVNCKFQSIVTVGDWEEESVVIGSLWIFDFHIMGRWQVPYKFGPIALQSPVKSRSRKKTCAIFYTSTTKKKNSLYFYYHIFLNYKIIIYVFPIIYFFYKKLSLHNFLLR